MSAAKVISNSKGKLVLGVLGAAMACCAFGGATASAYAAVQSDTNLLELNQYYLGSWDDTFSGLCGANVQAAWKQVTCDHKVTVAVLDTGVRATHEDLSANIDAEHAFDAVGGNTQEALTDSYKHGTHVAGIIAAQAGNGIGIDGVSHNAKVLPVNVFEQYEDSSGNVAYQTNSSILLRAYQYLDCLVESGELSDLHVINLSLGSYEPSAKDEELRQAIAHMRNEHAIVTVAAGGNGDSSKEAYTSYSYPCDFDECLCVTALDRDGTNIAWSDYNEYKDISAPGRHIWSTFADSDDDYAMKSGTSMAAPVVSGIMALLWALDPQLTVDDAVKAVTKTAHAVNASRNDRSASSGSAGAIDAAAAVEYVQIHNLGMKPSKATKLKVKSGRGRIIASWNAAARASRYQVAFRVKGKKKWSIEMSSKLEATVEGLHRGKRYQVRVRAKNATGYGHWSAVKCSSKVR